MCGGGVCGVTQGRSLPTPRSVRQRMWPPPPAVLFILLAWPGGPSLTGDCTSVSRPAQRSADLESSDGVHEANMEKRNSSESLASKKCKEYSEYVYTKSAVTIFKHTRKEADCGFSAVPLIVGGEDAQEKEFPHMVRLSYGDKSYGWLTKFGCGGSLVSERFVLSAAHCASKDFRGKKLSVRWALLGTAKMRYGKDNEWAQTAEVVEAHVHPDFREDRHYNDIALFRLGGELRLGPGARPACLVPPPSQPDRKYIATGWGRYGLSQTEGSASVLQKVSLDPSPLETCKAQFDSALEARINGTTMMCAGQSGKDTCYGDSGGPLQLKLAEPYCMYTLVGITSFGRDSCGGDSAAVYTRISAFIPWVESIVWKNEK